MSKTKAKPASKRRPERTMVVYGLGENKKPRAAKFSQPQFKLARKAADLMKLNVFVGKSANLGPVLKKLASGRIYASGEGFVPYIRRNQFDDLVSVISLEEPIVPEPLPLAPLPPASLPSSWASIKIGDLVLGQADSAADGWWPAIVNSIEGDMLCLQARDFPDVQVTRHRTAVALLHTADYVAPDHGDSAAPGLPVSWGVLAAGHLVIAQEDDADDGWWEAIVVEIDSDTLTLQWRDYPKQQKVTRQRTAVALLDPTPAQAA